MCATGLWLGLFEARTYTRWDGIDQPSCELDNQRMRVGNVHEIYANWFLFLRAVEIWFDLHEHRISLSQIVLLNNKLHLANARRHQNEPCYCMICNETFGAIASEWQVLNRSTFR